MPVPTEILDNAFQRASAHLAEPFITDTEVLERVDFVCRNIQNRVLAYDCY